MSARKIQATKNFRLFNIHGGENRPLDMKKHRKLEESMKLYGFLACFPIVCYRDKDGKLVVKDGQHRLAIAEKLGLSVHWVEEPIDFDVATINNTAKTWALRDYARKHATNGVKSYSEGLEFADRHHLPIGTAFSLLGGVVSVSSISEEFYGGKFKIKDRPWADAVAGIYGPITMMNTALKNARFIEACMAACRAPSFVGSRLIENAERCREKLVPYSTRDAYLDMLETIYNFGRHKLVGLKAEAMNAMKARNPVIKKKADDKTA